MKKIAIGVRTLKGKTGASAIILETASYLVQKGYQVDIYVNKLNQKLIDSYNLNAIKINVFGFGDYSKRKAFAKKFHKLTQKQNYDLIIGHGDIFYQDILFLHNTVFLANKLIPNEGTKKINSVGKIHDFIFQQGSFKKVIANSNLMKNELINRYNLDENKIQVIYPAIDLKRFNIQNRNLRRDQLKQQFNINKNDIVIGLVTSGNFKKRGVEIFLKACDVLNEKIENVKFILVGKEKNINNYFKKLNSNLIENLIYIPSYEKIEEIFYLLDFFVLPAYFEEFGLVANEAIASGAIPILSKNIGATEKIKSFREYLILEDLNDDEVVEKILFLLNNPNIFQKIASTLFKEVENYSWQEYSKKTFD